MQPAEDDTQRRSALGKAIVIRRTELGLTRNDLRDRSGLSYPYVAELEKGAKRMSAASLDAVSGALELRPSELLAMADALADDTSDFPPPSAPAVFAPASAPAPAPVTMAESSSRWFRARQAKPAAMHKTEAEAIVAADAVASVAADADYDAGESPEDARVRAIVRDELRKAGIEPGE